MKTIVMILCVLVFIMLAAIGDLWRQVARLDDQRTTDEAKIGGAYLGIEEDEKDIVDIKQVLARLHDGSPP